MFSGSASEACTLVAAVTDSGNILIKVRDSIPNHLQKVEKFQPIQGYSYEGVVAYGAENNITLSPLKSGVNEKGLAIAFSNVSTIPKDIRYQSPHSIDLVDFVLNQYQSIDEVVNNLDKIHGPWLFLLADPTEIARIELGREGQVSVERKLKGHLVLTNHYLSLDNIHRDPKERSLRRHQVLNDFFNELLPQTLVSAVEASKRIRVHEKSWRTLSIWGVQVNGQNKVSTIFEDYGPKSLCQEKLGNSPNFNF